MMLSTGEEREYFGYDVIRNKTVSKKRTSIRTKRQRPVAKKRHKTSKSSH